MQVRRVSVYVLIAAAYAVGSQLAFSWFGADGVTASFFPAAGVSFAALTLLPLRRWPPAIAAIAAAEFGVDVLHGIDLAPSLGYVVANVLQAVTGAAILRARARDVELTSPRSLGWFLLAGIVVAPTVGGILGATVHDLLDRGEGWGRFAGEWWVGDGLGVLVVAGTILAVRPLVRGSHRGITASWGESVALGTATIGSAWLAFHLEWFPLVYLPIFGLYVIALRAGTAPLAATSACTALVAGQQTASGHVLWKTLDVEPSVGLVYLQLALMVVITSALLLAASLAEQRAATIAYAVADAARIQSDQAQRRAERLGRLAEDLARVATFDDIARTALTHGVAILDLDASTPGKPPPRWHDVAGEGDILTGSRAVERMLRDAIRRVELIDAERRARLEAELLADSAAHLAAARSAAEVAEVTLSRLSRLGARDVAVWLRDGDDLMLAGATAPPLAGLHRRPVAGAPWSDASDGTRVSIDLRSQDGRVLGMLVVDVATDPDQRIARVVAAVANQCALALERTRLQLAAAQSAAEDAFLAKIAELLDRTTSVAERARRAVDAITGDLVTFAAIHLLDETDEPNLVATHGPLAFDAAADLLTAAHIRHAVREVVQERDRHCSTNETALLVTVPLEARSRTIGALTVGTEIADALPRDGFLRQIAARVAMAIDNAELYERERDVSHRLQTGLLGPPPPDVDGVAIGAAYRPGTVTLEVGGDWYDSFPLPDGTLALVVGDAVGHDLDAALAMAQLRGAVRALAATCEPAQLLEHLDMFVESVTEATMATLVYVALDPHTGEFDYACAGHPPPLVIGAEGTARYLLDGRSAPLGHALSTRSQAHDRLQVGDRLVLYTDGLVERRGDDLQHGFDRLVAAIDRDHTHPGLFVDRLCDRMLEHLPQDDDVCVLAVERRRAGTTTHCRTKRD